MTMALNHMTNEELLSLAVLNSDGVLDAVEAELDRRAGQAQLCRISQTYRRLCERRAPRARVGLAQAA